MNKGAEVMKFGWFNWYLTHLWVIYPRSGQGCIVEFHDFSDCSQGLVCSTSRV